ncbi:hypothetical protein NFI96_023881, partial [Prochilodus magdalenae]
MKTWPEGTSSQLQDCFEWTNWHVFEDQDLEEYTSTVLYYIKNCVDDVTVEHQGAPKPKALEKEARIPNERNVIFRCGGAFSTSPTTRPKIKTFTSLQQHHPHCAGRVLDVCADQLSVVLTKIFNLSLFKSIILPCLKSATIIPLAKKNTTSDLIDYRPPALTPVIMKGFERLVLHHIRAVLPPTLDPHQFVYKANRSTEDSITTAPHTALTHLEHQGSYVRMLFIVFNTVIPQTGDQTHRPRTFTTHLPLNQRLSDRLHPL